MLRRRLQFELLEDRRLLAVFTVNSTAGLGDSYLNDEICDTENRPNADPPIPPSGVCTLRAALEQAAYTDGADEIGFAIPGGGAPVIDINTVMNSGSIEIDGTTQPGGKVEIRGTLVLGGAGQHTVKGLVFNAGGLVLLGNGNSVVGNLFGTTPAGDALGPGAAGLEVTGDSNQIGGTDPAARNIVVGDVVIDGNNNRVIGNYIGVDVTGEVALQGGNTGVRITGGMDNQVGGDTPAHGNVIAAASNVGAIFVEKPVFPPEVVPQTIIRHNFIGTNKDGSKSLGNSGPGIVLVNAPNAAIFDNVIAASNDGILLRQGTNLTTIQRNMIGTDATGMVTDPDGVPDSGDEFGNRNAGILLNAEGLGATGNLIGGSLGELANVISGNQIGIRIFNFADGNHVEGNLIGVNATGTAALPNGKGVEIEFASHNVIGGLRPNVISGNVDKGIVIAGFSARDNLVANNRIGTNAAGTSAIPNGTGVLINDAPANCVGGILPGEPQPAALCGDLTSSTAAVTGNVISGNQQYGVEIANGNARQNVVQANRIGTNDLGMAAIPNGFDGVVIEAGADVNLIGGSYPNRRNVISGNTGDGVLVVGLAGDPSSGNMIAGNYIGVNVTGAEAVPNGARGIHLDAQVTQTMIGGELPGARNVISGNGLDGVIAAFDTTSNTTFRNNYIGTDSTGQQAVPNQRHGILILGSPNNKIGEIVDTSGLGNVISGNKLSGVRIEGPTATGNVLVNNVIGADATRTRSVKNEEYGIHLLHAPGNTVGGFFAENPVLPTFLGNVISGNASAGIKVEGDDADGNFIGANLIGLGGGGTQRIGNGGDGIHIVDAADTRIGVSSAGEPPLSGNTISANLDGIRIDGTSAANTLIGGNRIGTDWQGDPGSPTSALGNTVNGVWIRSASETYVGGLFLRDGQTLQVPGNTIAANVVGVRIEGDAAQFNKVQRNSIFENVELGIDLGAVGVTANDEDAKDADPGPNGLQNFPIIENYTALDSLLHGRLISEPGATFTLDLYKSSTSDPSGNGEGEIWVGEFTVTTDVNGRAEFALPVALDPVRKWLTLTATDGAGNTSEFSGPLRQADVTIDAFTIFPSDVVRNGGAYILPFDVTVRNIGTATAEFAEFRFFGNNQILHGTGGSVTLAPDESHTFSGTWNITPWLQANPRGVAAIELKAVADPDDLIDELPGGPNQRTSLMTADARPRIKTIEKEFAEGAFLEDVSLDNTIGVYVDWNGNLDGITIGQSDLPNVLVQVNGVETLPDGEVSVSEFDPTRFTIDMGDDLAVGANQIRVWAQLRVINFESDPKSIRYDQYTTVSWIEAPFWLVSEKGGPLEKTAEYKAKIFFPQVATGGFFDVPVDRVGLAGGAFGPTIPQAAVTAIIRSDRTSRIVGEFKMTGEVADKNLGGVDSSFTATAAGEFSFGSELDLKKLEAKLRGDVSVKGPKVPLTPYLPWVRAQAKFGLGVDAKLEWEEDANGDLAWNRNLILGLEPNAEFALIAGYDGVSVEVAGGGKLRGEFSLAANPCLLLGGAITLYARAKAEVWVFEASKTAEWTFGLPACGASGEGEVLVLSAEELNENIGLIPRYVLPAHALEGEASTGGLPAVAYPYAQPALARHSDGTMTLVYVSEDPAKADGQHLEIFATRYDGAAWSPPVQLTDDTFVDDAPAVVYDAAGNALAVWSRINTTLADPAQTDPHSLLGDLDLVYAVWDASSQAWSVPTALTANVQMDHRVQLARGADGTVMAVWLHDAGNDTPLFPDDDTRPLGADYLFSIWNGASWSAPAVAAGSVKTNAAPQFALGSGEGVLVWSEDSDGSLVTDADRDIRAAVWNGASWGVPVVLGAAGDGQADVSPQVAFDGSQAIIAWVKTGVPLANDADDFADQVFGVVYSAGAFAAEELWFESDNVTEPHLLFDDVGNAVLVWQGRSDEGPDIFVAVRDAASGAVSEPAPLTESPQYEWSLNPFFDAEGELEVLYLVRELGTEPAPQGGAGGEGEPVDPILIPTFLGSALAAVAGLLGPDLMVDALALDTPLLAPGSEVPVIAAVRNRGSSPTPSATIALLDDGVPAGAALDVPPLAAGEMVTLALPWSVPTGATAPHELTARIDPQNGIAETDETNNDAVLTALKPDLVVTDVTSVTTSAAIVVTAVVANQGGSPTLAPLEVVLRLDDPAATADLATHTISSPLAPGAAETVVFTIPDPGPSLLGSRPGWIMADAAQAVDESDEEDNAALAGLHPFLSWQNPLDRLDVSSDTLVDALDVLLNINRINAAGVGLLPVPPSPPLFYDVDGDGAVTPQDVLLVINFLNNRTLPATGGEGEAADTAPPHPPLPLASVLSSGHSAVLDFLAAWQRPTDYPTEPRPGATDVNQQPALAKFEAIAVARRGDPASQSPPSAMASRLPSIWDNLDELAELLDELAGDWSF